MEQQQADIVRNLLTHLGRQDIEDKEAPHSIPGEFMRLKNQSIKYRDDKTYPTKSAETQENIKKNRYKDILPFDHSRVKLTLTTSKADTDYINASFIKGVTGSKAYIATQGPLRSTVLDFLRMLWEYEINVIVMACREFEMGKKKCERYWPQKEEESFVCGPFIVHCVSILLRYLPVPKRSLFSYCTKQQEKNPPNFLFVQDCEEDKGAYLTRTLKLTYDNCCRTLKQLHYVNWPDHGVPNFILPILDMLEEMRTYQPHDDIPICIHCSAGCGRTGALCVIDYTWNLLRKSLITSDFNVCDLVHTMRTQRPSVVQTKEQYELVYSIIRLLFERYLQSVNAHNCSHQGTIGTSMIGQEDQSEEPQPLQHICDGEINTVSQTQESLPSGLVVTSKTDKKEKGLHSSQEVAVVEAIQQGDDALRSAASTITAEDICLAVEDPYFHTPLSHNIPRVNKRWTVGPIISESLLSMYDHAMASHSSLFTGSIGAHTDVDTPPPLPERTPESYQLAVDTEHLGSLERLTAIIPPHGDAEAPVDKPGDSPVSPVPSLPDRTPESYEMAVHQAPADNQLDITPTVNFNRIGTSSEWSGTSKVVSTAHERETKPWVRSKSLTTKTTFTEQLTPLWLPSPPPVAEGGSASAEGSRVYDVNQKASLSDGGASGDKADKNDEKAPSRKKSLKLFGDKQKLKPGTAALPTLSPSSNGVLMSLFKFGFGNRIGKPKGPRNYPQNWF
ncbi:tyrosine-protein phosphatase non-receptor type 22 isoform X2 [Dunckerocampus dactyliophorus]|uniref:tyrosine-protein phosphatase non-receptor type 22 isoform X2 n=1 Tax=Dunckerocampus dactyliophorus TaxID=161453 RepID=UPI0024052E4D|nr:tyrosine-protein phosphatase non-receptor type 22 isoform X2 [Dunckerocampus dactyliophorus]